MFAPAYRRLNKPALRRGDNLSRLGVRELPSLKPIRKAGKITKDINVMLC